MVVDVPISENSAYNAEPRRVDKSYKEKETNHKDKRSAKLGNIEDSSDYKNTRKGKIEQEENNNKSTNSFSISSHIPLLEYTDKFSREKKDISTSKSDKHMLAHQNSISIPISQCATSTTRQKKKDLNKDFTTEKLRNITKPTEEKNTKVEECIIKEELSIINKERHTKVVDNSLCKKDGSITPGKNYNAPLFVPSKYLFKNTHDTSFHIMRENCMYYPTYPSYYESPHHLSYYYNRSNSSGIATINQNLSGPLVEKPCSHLVHKPVGNEKPSKEAGEDGATKNESKSSSNERLSVIDSNSGPRGRHFTKSKPLKEQMADTVAVSVDCFTPAQDELQDTEPAKQSELHRHFSLSNNEETSYLASHPPVLSPITGNHGDLFINPEFATHLVPPDPSSTFMSFLSDGSMVGPMGEIYCPSTDYFLLDQNGDIPPSLISSPQGSHYDGKFGIMTYGRCNGWMGSLFFTRCAGLYT